MPSHSKCPSTPHALPTSCPPFFMPSLHYVLPPLCSPSFMPPFFTTSYNPALPLLLLLLLLAVLPALPTQDWRSSRSRSRMKGGGREGQACLKTSQYVAVLSVPAEEEGPGGGPREEREEMQDLLKEDMIFYSPLALFPLAFPPAVPSLGFFLPRRS